MLSLLSEIRPQIQFLETEQAVSERTKNNGQSIFNTHDTERGRERHARPELAPTVPQGNDQTETGPGTYPNMPNDGRIAALASSC